MKKVVITLFLIFIIIVAIIILPPIIVHIYSEYPLSAKDSASLSSSSYEMQIAYNIIYLSIAVIVLLVAYFQLTKTREANTIQTLNNIDNYLKSSDFLNKRKKLAEYVLKEQVDILSNWLNDIKSKTSLTNDESQKMAVIKNTFEDVIYQFEFIAYYYAKKIFSLEDVYQLFSIEIQQYWVLMYKLRFIEYLRNNNPSPRKDYYDKFERLFNDTLKQELIHDASYFLRPLLRCYYWSGLYKIFYYLKKTNNIYILTNQNISLIPKFLVEEKNLI
jgi:uncharacterized membrane protein